MHAYACGIAAKLDQPVRPVPTDRQKEISVAEKLLVMPRPMPADRDRYVIAVKRREDRAANRAEATRSVLTRGKVAPRNSMPETFTTGIRFERK